MHADGLSRKNGMSKTTWIEAIRIDLNKYKFEDLPKTDKNGKTKFM